LCHSGAWLALEAERSLIQTSLRTIEQATGRRPRGWLGSGLTETYNTLDILAEDGVVYCGDWNSTTSSGSKRRAIVGALHSPKGGCP